MTTPYLDATTFRAGAASFGCDSLLSDATLTDPVLTTILSDASLMINNYANRTYWANPQTETHAVSFYDRRIRVNMPPVASITSLSVLTAPNVWTALSDLTTLIVDNQDNYIEIPQAAFSTATPPAPVDWSDQLPLVQVVYTSMQSPLPPENVARATGFVAAMLLQKRAANAQIAPGLSSVEIVGEVKVSRPSRIQQQEASKQTGDIALPDEAVQLLVGEQRLWPNGYRPAYYPTRTRDRGRWW